MQEVCRNRSPMERVASAMEIVRTHPGMILHILLWVMLLERAAGLRGLWRCLSTSAVLSTHLGSVMSVKIQWKAVMPKQVQGPLLFSARPFTDWRVQLQFMLSQGHSRDQNCTEMRGRRKMDVVKIQAAGTGNLPCPFSSCPGSEAAQWAGEGRLSHLCPAGSWNGQPAGLFLSSPSPELQNPL